MTLIMGFAFKSDFVIFSSDTKIVRQRHSLKTQEIVSEEIKQTNETIDKVKPLSNFTLIATGGNLEAGQIVEEELMKVIRPEYTLEQCAEELQNVINMLWKKRRKYLGTKKRLAINFIGTKHFSCYIMGYLKNGKTGLANIRPDTITVELIENPMNDEGMGFISSPDEKDMVNYSNWLRIRDPQERNLSNYIQQFKLIHGKLSYEHKIQVSPDCNLYVLYREKENLFLSKDVVDTSELYPMFETHPKIDYKTYYKFY